MRMNLSISNNKQERQMFNVKIREHFWIFIWNCCIFSRQRGKESMRDFFPMKILIFYRKIRRYLKVLAQPVLLVKFHLNICSEKN